MKIIVRCVALAVLAVLMSGCATLIRKDVKEEVIHEEPVVAPDAAFEKE